MSQSPKRLIVVVREGDYQRTYHMMAKLKTKESIGGRLNLFMRLKATSDGITACEYIDHCSVMITIGKAWTGQWDKIEDSVLRVLISEVRWMYKEVHIQRADQKKPRKVRVKIRNRDIAALQLSKATI